MRERLKRCILDQMRVADETGVPPMRPLFFDLPADSAYYEVGDERLIGPDILAAPLTEYRFRSRTVYLRPGAEWTNAWTGATFKGGQTVEKEAPLERIPVFLKRGGPVLPKSRPIP